MLALAIIISVLILLALLRFGVIAEYSEAGFHLWAKVGFLKFHLTDDKKEKKKPKKKKKKKEKKKGQISIIPGSLSEFTGMLRAVKNTLGRLKRKLLIKQLTLYFTSAGDDPAGTAIKYGAANAVFGLVVPLLEKHFRIKRYDLRTFVDFCAQEQGIYAKVTISIAVWEVFYVIFALFPIITTALKSKPAVKSKPDDNDEKKEIIDRKDGQDNGKSAD